MENLFGFLAMLSGMLTFIVGLSAQALKHYREKRCGLSIVFVCFGITTCVVRVVYFALSGTYWTIAPDVVGFALSAIIIYQYGTYERRWW